MKKVLVIASVIAMAQTSFPQTKTGTTIGQFLLIEPSARFAAMGNAAVGTYSEVFSAYYNPAALGMLQGYRLQFTHSQWLADITYNYAGLSIAPADWGTLYVSATSLNSGEIDVRTVEKPLGTGERYTVSNIAFGIGYGRQISDRFSAGVQVSYIQETIWHSSLSTITFNVGTMYRIAPDGLHIGASISNFGIRAKYSGRDLRFQFDRYPNIYGDNSALPGELFLDDFAVPVLFRVGVSMPWKLDDDNGFHIVLDALHPSDNTESISIGAEYGFKNTLFLRGGYQNLFQQDAEMGLTLGAGVNYSVDDVGMSFDYAWGDYGRLDETHRLTVGIAF